MSGPETSNGWDNAKLVTENWETEVDNVVNEVIQNRKNGIDCSMDSWRDDEFVYLMVRFSDHLESRAYMRLRN